MSEKKLKEPGIEIEWNSPEHCGEWRTVMRCYDEFCKNEVQWLGDYTHAGPYICSKCRQEMLYGSHIYYRGD